MAAKIDNKGNVVRLKDENDNVIGTGVLYYETSLGERLYVFTAAHCLFKDGDHFCNLREKIIVEIYSYIHSSYEPVVVNKLSEVVVCSDQKDVDYAVIVLNKVDVDSINPYLEPIQIVNSCSDAKKMFLLGFPKANEHKEVLVSNVTKIADRIGERQFLLQMEQGIGSYYASGYSGGGVFIDNSAGESVLLGLFVRIQEDEERGNFGYGQYIKGINTLLESKRLPMISYYYYGVNGLTHNKLSNLCKKTKDNIGPDFGIDVKTSIQPILDAICRNDGFIIRYKDTLGKWFNEIHFYSNETTSQTGLLEKEFITVKDTIAKIINNSNIRIPNNVDFSKCSSLIDDFMTKVKSYLNVLYGQRKLLQGESDKRDKDTINGFLSRLFTLERYCSDFGDAIEKTNYKFTNTPIAIIEGEAGCGKSHILGKLSDTLIGKRSPVIFLLGRDFNANESIEWNIKKLVDVDCDFESFLNSCNSIGIERNQRFMFLVDAINETEGRHYWKNNLNGFVRKIERYPALGLIVTVRTTYYKDEIPDSFCKDDSIHIIHHNGLRGKEDEAIKKFCEYYKIAAPTLPLLNPEYSNPLMLHISCQVAQREGNGRFIMAHTGASSLFDAYRKMYDEIFGEKDLAYKSRHIVSKSIYAIVNEFIGKGSDHIGYETCYKLLYEKVDNSRTLLNELVASCILSKDTVYGEDEEQVRLTYQRLSDFYLAEALVKDCSNKDEVTAKFSDRPYKNRLYKNANMEGIVEQLAIILPEKFDVEFWEVIDLSEIDYLYRSGADILFDSLAWRSREHIATDKIINYLKSEDYSYYDYLNTLVLLAPIPSHPFNSDRWHNIMKHMDLPHREQVLQRFLLDYSDTDENYSYPHIDRLVEWAWRKGVSSEIDDEVARLTGQLMAWFLCTTKNTLRDRTTKAMVNLLQEHASSLVSIMKAFEGVDDPYIIERLYAVAYGCTLRTPELKDKRLIGEYVYKYVFVNTNLPRHLLTRDYMCNIVEYAVKVAGLEGVNMNIILPPYNEQMPDFPSEEEIALYRIPYESGIPYKYAQNDISNSVIDGLADFGTKIVDPYVDDFCAWSFVIEEEYDSFKRKTKGNNRKLLDCYEILSIKYDEFNENKERYHLWKPAWSEESQRIMEACFEKLPFLSEQLNVSFGEIIANKIRDEYIPNRSIKKMGKYAYGLNQIGVRRWIVKRVFDLGYNKDLHGEYDEYVKRLEGYGRHNSTVGKTERIGKKYEWIALWEILGCIADSHCIENPWNTTALMKYDGAWQHYWRDIDPSCITRRYEVNQEPSWHEYPSYPYWNQEVKVWMETTLDTTDVQHLLQREDFQGNKWLTIHDYKNEYEPREIGSDRWGVESRYYNISIFSYIINAKDKERLIKYSKGKNFFGLRLLEPGNSSLYHISREKYWSRGTCLEKKYFKDKTEPLFEGCPVKGIFPIELMNGNMENDHSGTRATYYMPRENIMKLLNARYSDEDGVFLNQSNEPVVCCNPGRTIHSLFRKDCFLDAIHSIGKDLIWIVVLEKIYNPRDGSHNNKMTMPSGLYYMDDDGIIKGTMTLHTRP